MLGNPNHIRMFSVYNATTALANTPSRSLTGSRIKKLLHYKYFQDNY